MTEEPGFEDIVEISTGLLLLALVLFLFIDVGTIIYSIIAVLTTGMLFLGFLYKLTQRKFDYAFLIAGLFSPIPLVIAAVLLVGSGAILGGVLGLLGGFIGSFIGAMVGGVIGIAMYEMLQMFSYLIYSIFGILILLQGLDYTPVEDRTEIKF